MALSWLVTGAAAGSISAQEWSLYKEKFLDPTGRIVDNANGNISHSEGQGYGLLLSYLAGSRGDFDRIWAFTRREMLVRNDGLAAWKWDPSAQPHVSDLNNATDGDLLIAYSLALAGAAWERPDLTQVATAMARQLASAAVERTGRFALLKPGVTGFTAADRPDGPVVNPSYWVFEALPVMAELTSDNIWNRIGKSGRALLVRSVNIGKAGLPPDWVSLNAKLAVAKGFSAEFGYNALRIPLYLLRAGMDTPAILQSYIANMADDQGNVRIVEIASGNTKEILSDPGYRIVPALLTCVTSGTRLPGDTVTFMPKDYYPSTLQLLSLSYARLRHPECL
jgi:endoglucanase